MPKRVLVFVTLVFASSVTALVGLFVREPGVSWALFGGAASFAVLGAFAHLFNYKLHGKVTGAATLTPFLVAVILYPAWPTVLLVAAAVSFAEFSKKKQPAIKRLFNISQQVLAASSAVSLFHALGGTSLQQDQRLQPIPEAGALIGFLVVNTLAVAAVVAISERKNFLVVWRDNVAGSLINYAVSIPWVHAFALVYCKFEYNGVLFIAFLLFGLRQGGMHTVGKHFPGHGYVQADSHLDIPVDEREFVDIEMCDLVPFRQMVNYGLTAVMPAHVIYPKVDSRPAGFSPVWLKNILRGQLGFEGCIFSDDLSMEGAAVAGGIVQRAEAALDAGCDMVLVCNKPESADELLQGLHWEMPAASRARLAQMRGRSNPDSPAKLHEQQQFLKALDEIAAIGMSNAELPLA